MTASDASQDTARRPQVVFACVRNGGQEKVTVRRIIAALDTRVRDLLVELVPAIELPPIGARPGVA